MAKVVAVNHLTLDGVMQAPARFDEDTRDGFAHGGWAIPGNDQVMIAKIGEREAADAVAELKQRPLGGLTIFGSGELIKSLMAADLIDECLLMIHPLVLGSGRSLFPPGHHAQLRLTNNVTTTTGVVIAIYEPARHGPI